MTHTRGDTYELVVQEPFDPSWSDWFDGFAITVAENRGTKIVGLVTDQTALHGLLARIRNLNLTVISVARIEDTGESCQEEDRDESACAWATRDLLRKSPESENLPVAHCPFCSPALDMEKVVLEDAHCMFLQGNDPVLVGSGLIIPKCHRETVFDLTVEEWQATFDLLQRSREWIDEKYVPDGYNVGWNCGPVGGQEVMHAHLHIIPRFRDEPFAGKGIRYSLKQDSNARCGRPPR